MCASVGLGTELALLFRGSWWQERHLLDVPAQPPQEKTEEKTTEQGEGGLPAWAMGRAHGGDGKGGDISFGSAQCSCRLSKLSPVPGDGNSPRWWDVQ